MNEYFEYALSKIQLNCRLISLHPNLLIHHLVNCLVFIYLLTIMSWWKPV